jgi:hypothetical protein
MFTCRSRSKTSIGNPCKVDPRNRRSKNPILHWLVRREPRPQVFLDLFARHVQLAFQQRALLISLGSNPGNKTEVVSVSKMLDMFQNTNNSKLLKALIMQRFECRVFCYLLFVFLKIPKPSTLKKLRLIPNE